MSKLHLHLKKFLALASRHEFIVERTIENPKGSYSMYEYGPLGTEVRRNLRQLWWKDVVTHKESVSGIETSMFDPENGSTFTEFEESGTIENASKWIPDDREQPTKHVSNMLENHNTTKRRNNLRELSSISRSAIQVKTRNDIYNERLGMPYRTSLPSDSISLPQGFAWNEKYLAMKSDDSNFLRNIEEEMLCLKYYVEARTAKYWLNFWKRERLIWWRKFANVPSNFSSFEVQQNSRANFTTEIQYAFPWGNEQIDTIEYWPNSNPHLILDSDENHRIVYPDILQASASLNKGFVALLVDAFEEKERGNSSGDVSTRSVLCLHPSLAPIKVAILSQNIEKNELSEVSRQLASELCQAGICTSSKWDGRPPEEMYAYNDEIGTPYCITILESTLSNGVVVLRNRDTTLQEFVHISDVLKTLQCHLKTEY